LSIHLRLDDVYSYLAVQQLPQIEEILADELKPLKVVISSQAAVVITARMDKLKEEI
jgi:hypothetical protein